MLPLDPGAVADPGGDQPAPLRLAVSAGDGTYRDPQLVRQRPVGGQTGLGGQRAIHNRLLDGAGQSEVEGAIEGGEIRCPDCHGDNKSIDRNLRAI